MATTNSKRAKGCLTISESYSNNSATRPSVSAEEGELPSLDNVRHFSPEEVHIDKSKVLGKGVFGKCFSACVGSQNACVKIIRKGSQFEASFAVEAHLLSQCCHTNIPFLFGVMTSNAGYKCLLMSFHGINEISYTLHNVITKNPELLTSSAWKKVVVGIVRGLLYLHTHKNGPILHNDLKNDNIVLGGNSFECVKPCIIDYGKACFQINGKLYQLSKSEQEMYKKRHPQVAPELRDGTKRQSTKSDIYSFGRILSAIYDILSIPALQSMADMSLDYDSDKRPTTHDLCKFLENLLL